MLERADTSASSSLLGIPVFNHPMIGEANIWSAEQGFRLRNQVLLKQLAYTQQHVPRESLYGKHLRKMRALFPEVSKASRIPEIWKWEDLVWPTDNLVSVREAGDYVRRGLATGQRMAYITGGLEWTIGQWEAMRYLILRGYHIVMGHEPYVYVTRKGERNPLTDSCVPMSYWSKFLGKNGVIFTIPRPLPMDHILVNTFYDDLYEEITERKVPIIISHRDPYWKQKMERGPSVMVPKNSYPSTTELYRSVMPHGF